MGTARKEALFFWVAFLLFRLSCFDFAGSCAGTLDCAGSEAAATFTGKKTSW